MKKLFLLLTLVPCITRAMDKEAVLPLTTETSALSTIPLVASETRTQSNETLKAKLKDLIKQQALAFNTAFSTGQLTFAACKHDNEFVKLAIGPSVLLGIATLLEVLQTVLPEELAILVRTGIAPAAVIGTLASIAALVIGSKKGDAELIAYGVTMLLLGALPSTIMFFELAKFVKSGKKTFMELLPALSFSAIAGLSLGDFIFATVKDDHEMILATFLPFLLSSLAMGTLVIKALSSNMCSSYNVTALAVISGFIAIPIIISGSIEADSELMFYGFTLFGLAILGSISSAYQFKAQSYPAIA